MLKWIEQALVTSGSVAAVLYALAVLETDYVNSLPPPRSAAVVQGVTAAAIRPSALPGEDDAAAVAAGPPAPGSWVARLEIPSVNLEATVLEGSDPSTLSRAAGRIEYTARPGTSGNLGIAGHRDTVFRPLRRLKVGDVIRLTTAHGVREYRVEWQKVVEPDAVHVLDPTPHPALTLVTCYPFTFVGTAPKRYVVRAEEITNTAKRTE